MNNENTSKLVNTFPLLYSEYDPLFRAETKMFFNFDVMDGWFDLIWELSEKIYTEIERLKNEGVPLERLPRVTQVKEKYGELVFDVVAFNDKINEWVVDAERESLTICEICGKPGKPNIDIMTEPIYEWIMVRCPEHWDISPAEWNKIQWDKEHENFYTEETIQKMINKAKDSFDSADFNMGIIICGSGQCPKKAECFRYAIYDSLVKNEIYGHTVTAFKPENCIHFIPILKNGQKNI